MNEISSLDSSKSYSNAYTIYKPNQRGSGGAIRFQFNPEKKAIFVECANQSSDKLFDWDQKIIMKWGLSDIGTTLATLQGRQTVAKLYHKTEKASCICELTLRDDPERAPYSLAISRQVEVDKSVRKVSIPLLHSEAAILESALRIVTSRILGW